MFNIGSQQAGSISNVGGDQHIGRLDATFHAGALQSLGDLRAALAAADLPGNARQQAASTLDEVEGELQRPTPDKARVAGHLEGLARLIASFGALVSAGDRLVQPLSHLAGWLGPLGHGLAALLP